MQHNCEKVRFQLCLICVLVVSFGFGQTGSISGSVVTEKGEAIPGAYVQVSNGQGTVTDISGSYILSNLPFGNLIVSVSCIGFQSYQHMVNLSNGQQLTLRLVLQDEVTQLGEVMITAKSEGQELKESTASVAVLEAKSLYALSNQTSDVVKQISGVNVRQTGGFGSEADISINGMTGKQVKFFLDGIPLSYFGLGLGLNVLPVNLMKQIEVYKGVVPIHLGADALGGAINIIPRREYTSFIDAAYSFGSFNSHKANVNAQLVNLERHLIVGVNSFYNHSDNNYKVEVEIPNEFGNPEPVKVRRFHDQFSNYLLNTYVGVYDKPFADRLVFSTRYSGLNDEIQHNAIMAQPYGEVSYEESTFGLSTEYEKKDILPATSLKWYGGVNYTKGHFTDTTLNIYTWDGEVDSRRTDGGEISTSRNLLTLEAKNAVSRLNVTHHPWEQGSVSLNVFTSWFRRTGEDPVAAEFYGEDFYQNPTMLIKNATGLAYQHKVGRLTSYTALKHFVYMAEGYAIENMEMRANRQSVSNIGYSESIRYQFSDALLAKASYEYATRLPDEFELFGDFTLVRPNPFLKPEQSHNANVGVQYYTPRFTIDFNGFYRRTDNIIWLRTSQFYAQYQNLLKAEVKGFDMEMTYKLFPSLRLKTNATYQDIRNRSGKRVTGSIDGRYYGARLPNIPYLFGNAEIRYECDDFLRNDNRLSAWWSAGYVHEFYLYWAVDGNPNLKNTIPSQFIQNVGLTYSMMEERYFLTLEASNLFDQKAYDNFSVQRPGRTFYITLRTYINQKLPKIL